VAGVADRVLARGARRRAGRRESVSAVAAQATMRRAAARITVQGAVQGTGFRPFVFRLAESLDLAGSVRNTPFGVRIAVEGPPAAVEEFCRRLPLEPPPAAVLRGVAVEWTAPEGAERFDIEASEPVGELLVAMLPDLATCPDCVRELFDPTDRRFGYVFLNCTACGPRLSIIEGLPYDRPLTAMRRFRLCPDCAREYHDPRDRRFHAQPVACPQCGPRLSFEGGDRTAARGETDPLQAAAAVVRAGRILALKGVGGYQLIVDARDDAAVARLRARKGREAKPLAVMFPGLESLRRAVRVGDEEAKLLTSASAPILLLPLLDRSAISAETAPGLHSVGAMVPYSPLHHMLLASLGFPVVCTSGNFSEEPMAIDADDARRRLGAIADAFLHHDRPIVRHVDDSVARVVEGSLLVMRRARGFAALPLQLRTALPTVRALGGHLKSAAAWTHGTQIIASQHVGDLDDPLALEALQRTVADYERLYGLAPVAAACDLHPDYASTRLAEASGLPVMRVQHHHAHVASVLAEHDLEGEVLGVAWDGTGMGTDGTVWGGEFLQASAVAFRRVARLLPFWLPGGEAAARQPWRSALGVLHQVYGEALWDLDVPPVHHAQARRPVLDALLRASGCSVRTSSAGRLYDAVASLLSLRQESSYEAQAAMQLEQVAQPGVASGYPFSLAEVAGPPGEALVEVDWRPAVAGILGDLGRGVAVSLVAGKFHRTLAQMIGGVAEWAGVGRVVLAGGCFQNAALLTLAVRELKARGFDVAVPCRIPPNDGGLAVGQAMVAAHQLLERGG
jgi:hydrogenase maturation protein HypF